MNNLEKQSPININSLNQTYFFQSFLQEAYNHNILSSSKLENIQIQSLELLTEQIERFTSRNSSSVKIETAQNILQSIYYTIGIYLKTFHDIDSLLNIIKHTPISDLFYLGKELIKSNLSSAKNLLTQIQHNCIKTDNLAYNDTLNNGLPLFFTYYDIEYAAHDTPGSIDYPLAKDSFDLVGIEYIYNYLKKLYLENEFCSLFDLEDIHSLLYMYDESYGELLINIFELVIVNSLGSIIIGGSAYNTKIELSNILLLHEQLNILLLNNLELSLNSIFQKLCTELNINDASKKEYYYEIIHDLSIKTKNALNRNQLETVFIFFRKEKDIPSIELNYDKKMDDECFRKITNQIRECRYVSDKISIIKNVVQGITDLIDIFESNCIFGDEYISIFNSFSNVELTLLKNKIKHETSFNLYVSDKEWQKYLTQYL